MRWLNIKILTTNYISHKIWILFLCRKKTIILLCWKILLLLLWLWRAIISWWEKEHLSYQRSFSLPLFSAHKHFQTVLLVLYHFLLNIQPVITAFWDRKKKYYVKIIINEINKKNPRFTNTKKIWKQWKMLLLVLLLFVLIQKLNFCAPRPNDRGSRGTYRRTEQYEFYT